MVQHLKLSLAQIPEDRWSPNCSELETYKYLLDILDSGNILLAIRAKVIFVGKENVRRGGSACCSVCSRTHSTSPGCR